MTPQNNIILIILDGWGLSNKKEGNPTLLARTPNFDYYWKHYPKTKLFCHGKYVGLPDNQDGNSEAGHMNLGAGRVVLQDAVYILNSIKDGTFFKNTALIEAVKHVKKNKSKMHLMGLLSGVESPHAYPDHIYGLFELMKRNNIKPVYLHLFTDGRDSSPHSAVKLLRDLKKHFKNGEIVATICGRFYAMDRKKEWANIERVYNLLTLGEGIKSKSSEEAITRAYDQGLTDEFILPSVIMDNGERPRATIDNGDSIIFFNLRSDRTRELTKTFVQEGFEEMNEGVFKRKKIVENIKFVAMTDFGPDLPNILTAYPSRDVINSLPFVLRGYSQLYISEAEKYAHVTFFFNGGWEGPVAGEERIMIPSPPVEHYDEIPEMSSEKVTEILIDKIKSKKYNFICVNYANPDMIGHTGNLDAGIRCCEIIDNLLGRVVKESLENNFTCLISSDHGNIEEMKIQGSKEVDTKHSKNQVPLILVSKNKQIINLKLKQKGCLGDVAPTILELMNIKKPREMTRKSLIIEKKQK